MTITSSYEEIRFIGNKKVDSVRLMIDGADIASVMAAYPEYTEVLEHFIVLYKPSAEDTLRVKLDTIATALPDDIAVEYPDLYPVWMEGMALGIGDRVQHSGGLYRVQQAHTAEHPPSVNTAALYTRINAPGAISAWVTGQSYAKDVQVTHNGKTWVSVVDNNVWEPGAAGVFDSIWKEV